MTSYYFVEPTDSIFVRGNLSFGDSGEHGVGVIPPPPSLFAGAFRSAILGRDSRALAQFTQHGRCDDPTLATALGSVEKPGAFRIAWLSLAGQATAETSPLEPVFPLPADLVCFENEFANLTPGEASRLVEDGRTLPRVAVLRAEKQEKPKSGIYLREAGWKKHLAGELPDNKTSGIEAKHLHTRDPRLGIGLNTDSRTAESGLIYTTEGHAFSPKESAFSATGFLVGIEGADSLLPESGFLRLGGDGRGARYRRVNYQPPAPPLATIDRTGRFRLILTTPGLFAEGWLPSGVSARLVCAAVPRREVISGWDLFNCKPKDAKCVAPAGSVYWFEDIQGDADKLAERVAGGLWNENADMQRKAEGYNNAVLAAWPND